MGEDLVEAPQGESKWGALIGMLLSGGLSLFIAWILFMIGVWHEDRLAERELRGLVQFMAVETSDVYSEAVAASEQLLHTYRMREMVSPQIVDAENIGQALSLEADPRLAAAVREVYGKREDLRQALAVALPFGEEHDNFTKGQSQRILGDLTAMGEGIDVVLEIARDMEVDERTLAALTEQRTKATASIEAMNALTEEHLPDIDTTLEIDMGVYSGHGEYGSEKGHINIHMNSWSNMPFKIKNATTDFDGVTLTDGQKESVIGARILPEEEYYIQIWYPRWPQMPRGPFKKTVVVQTTCPGYEKIEVPITGTVEHVFLEWHKVSHWHRTRGRKYHYTTYDLWNMTEKPLTVLKATCTIPDTEVRLPENLVAPPAPRDDGEETPVTIGVWIAKEKAPRLPVEGLLILETDAPGYERFERKLTVNVRW